MFREDDSSGFCSVFERAASHCGLLIIKAAIFIFFLMLDFNCATKRFVFPATDFKDPAPEVSVQSGASA